MTQTLPRPLRIGTRGSPLARAQTDLAVESLREAEPALDAPDAVEVLPIKTTGDRITDRPLYEVGGKGLFAKEIEAALLDGRIDLAVHSMKDLETRLPDGLTVAGVLARADPRDALIFRPHGTIRDLPGGGRLGTTSLRRAAQVRALRPDLQIVTLRGNVKTRLEKVRGGEMDATLLAVAGLERLGEMPPEASPVDPETLLPAAGQGIIALQCRADDGAVQALLRAASDARTWIEMTAEHALLAALDGSCRTPIGALARASGAALTLDGLVAAPDGTTVLREQREGDAADAEHMGRELGEALKAQANPAWFEE